MKLVGHSTYQVAKGHGKQDWRVAQVLTVERLPPTQAEPTRQPLQGQQVKLVNIHLVSSKLIIDNHSHVLTEKTRQVAVENVAKFGQQHRFLIIGGDLNTDLDKLVTFNLVGFHIWGQKRDFIISKGLTRTTSSVDGGAGLKSDAHTPMGGVYEERPEEPAAEAAAAVGGDRKTSAATDGEAANSRPTAEAEPAAPPTPPLPPTRPPPAPAPQREPPRPQHEPAETLTTEAEAELPAGVPPSAAEQVSAGGSDAGGDPRPQPQRELAEMPTEVPTEMPTEMPTEVGDPPSSPTETEVPSPATTAIGRWHVCGSPTADPANTTASGAADSRPAADVVAAKASPSRAGGEQLQPEAGPASREPPESAREESPCWDPEPDVPQQAHLHDVAKALIDKSSELRQELKEEEEEEANAGPADSRAGETQPLPALQPSAMLRPCSLLRLPDGSWKLDTREHTVQKVAEVLEFRLKACREQMACELTMQGCPPADVASLPIPPGYILQGTFMSQATREFKARLAPHLLAQRWSRHSGATEDVNFNGHKIRQAFAAYCHATYGDKKVFDWLLRHGGLDERAADALTQETLRVRAADGAANSRPAAGAQPPPPRTSGRDPNPNVVARIAASQRRDAARQENYHLRLQGVLEEPGACDACGYYGALTACYWCQRAVCSWHHVRGYLVCLDCDPRHGRELRNPSHMPRDRRPPQNCDTLRCQRQDLRGQCITCNRYICEGCSMDQPLTHCVVCGALSRGDGFVAFHFDDLRLPVPLLTCLQALASAVCSTHHSAVCLSY